MFFINGSYVNETEAKISVLDLGILRGFGIFDYLRTYLKKPFHLWDHLLRLKYSADTIGLELPYSLEEIADIATRVIEGTTYPEVSLKIVATGGISPDQWTPQNPGTLIVFAYPLTSPSQECYEKGIQVVTTPLFRSLPSCKTTQYLPGIVSLNRKKSMEALYVNPKGEILEATTSNFFGVKGDRLYTCSSEEILEGITREVVLNLAKDQFQINFTPVSLDEIAELDEAFITSSSREVMPVTTIDEILIGKGVVGPVTRQIMTLFREYTLLQNWPLLNISRYTFPVLKENV